MSSGVPPRFATMRNLVPKSSLSCTTSSTSDMRCEGKMTNCRGSLRTRSYTGLVMARTRPQSSRPHSHATWMKVLAGRVSISWSDSLTALAATSFRATRSSRKPTLGAYGVSWTRVLERRTQVRLAQPALGAVGRPRTGERRRARRRACPGGGSIPRGSVEVFLGMRVLLRERLAEAARMLSRTLLDDSIRLIWLAGRPRRAPSIAFRMRRSLPYSERRRSLRSERTRSACCLASFSGPRNLPRTGHVL